MLICAPATAQVLARPQSVRPLLSFDGGARSAGPDVRLPPGSAPRAGAGVVLWASPDRHGTRRCLLQASFSLPRIGDPGIAEAAALGYGLQLLAYLYSRPPNHEVLGDNLGVVRLGAGNARLRRDDAWLELGDSLMLASRGLWDITWLAVRRHHNKAADALATAGVFRGLARSPADLSGDSASLWWDVSHWAEHGLPSPARFRAARPLSIRVVSAPMWRPPPIC